MSDLEQVLKVNILPAVRHIQRRQRVVLMWMAVLTVVSVVNLGVAVATLVEVII